MTAPAIIGKQLTDDEVLNYTQDIRKRFVDEIVKDKLPVDDKGTAGLMLQALADMDRTAIGKKKIVIEQGQSESDRMVANALAQLAQNPNLPDLFSAHGKGVIIDADVSRLPQIDHVPGQDAVGIEDRNYDGFIKDVEGSEDDEA